jgi:CRP/FNR family transcriptional regulator, anaerobic regulatory protein
VNIFTPSDIYKRFPKAMERSYNAGQIIIYDGDAPNLVRFIKSGAVKFYDTDADGKQKIMHIGGEGSIFPLFYSFESKDSVTGYYETISPTEVIAVPLVDFQNELKTSPDYAFMTLRWYAEEMDHIVQRLKSLEKSSAKHKILQALLYLSEQHATQSKTKTLWYRINFTMTQQDIADITGLTRETVNIALQDPELKKMIRTKRQHYEIYIEKVKASLTQ